jgi:hypothetical protein
MDSTDDDDDDDDDDEEFGRRLTIQPMRDGRVGRD